MATLTSIINNIIQKVNNLTSSKVSKITSPTANSIVKVNADGSIDDTSIIVDDNGNVGFRGGNGGSSNLSAGLVISASDGGNTTIYNWLDTSSIDLWAGITQKTGIHINGQTASGGSYVSINTGGTERVRIDASGNLQVNGSISSEAIQVIYNGDLNDYKTRTQVIGTSPSGYVSNIPINDHGYLEVIVYSPNAWVMQRFTTLGTSGVAPGRIFVRCFVNGTTWTAWVEK